MDQIPDSSVAETEQNLTTTDGRGFQKKNDAYTLPTDRNEHSRLDLQHEAVRIILGCELYQTPELVRATLSLRENTKRRILDIGAGSGKWAIEMAEEFPHADVLGIDLVEPDVLSDPTRRVPSNCSFQKADANEYMEKIDSVYDLVHFRCVELGIHDSDLFFYDAARVLRPGGLLLLMGADPKLVDEKGQTIPVQKPGTIGMLGSNPNYSDVQVQELLIRTVPWSNDMNETERKLAETMQANVLRLLPAFKASILRDKTLPEEFVNELFEGAMKEVREVPVVIHRYVKWFFGTAVRNETAWTARKGPWQEPLGYDVYDYVVRPLYED
ncbi:hypothetical protein FS837_012620 [Tulasnella sp. UAMH 9824]|nr:hypothetical protein FS837_012620 [Tulasnella sp. UAMH 9824]